MKEGWSILYRGPLSSCNYACEYCPFAKARNTREQLQEDELCLQRFTQWVAGRDETIGILFTPWGEALIHRCYQRALCELSRLPNVRRVAIQTNLSCRLDWVAKADRQKLGLWCTYHPKQIALNKFLGRCQILDQHGVRYSVGIVGVREALPFLEPLRAGLRPEVYVWVNAFKRGPAYYSAEEVSFLAKYDPFFLLNTQRHLSLGRTCRTGHRVFSVDGKGDIRRCHFVKTILGNIYQPGFEKALQPHPCPVETCGCHIGYVHMEDLALDRVFGEGMLERIPANGQSPRLIGKG